MPTYIEPISKGVTDCTNEDTNDCALRAYCNVTGKSFTDAQLTFAIQGRKYKKGTNLGVLHKVYSSVTGMKPVLMGIANFTRYMEVSTGMKSTGSARALKSLLSDAKYSKGKYVFLSKNHAMAVIDGKVVDTFASKGSTRIYMIYSYEETSGMERFS